MLDFVAEYEQKSTTALSAGDVVVPVLTINNWILMQRKIDGAFEEWLLSWAEYRAGFGSLEGSDKYWLGLDKIYRLTQLGSVTLRVEVTTGGPRNLR